VTVASALSRRDLVRAAAQRSLTRRRITGRLARRSARWRRSRRWPRSWPCCIHDQPRRHRLSWSFLVNAPTPPASPGRHLDAITGSAGSRSGARHRRSPSRCWPPLSLRTPVAAWPLPCASAPTFSPGCPRSSSGSSPTRCWSSPARLLHLAAAFALAVLMLPIMIRADEEAMRNHRPRPLGGRHRSRARPAGSPGPSSCARPP